jgi:diaminohydroxyphosphoribosylaminopyrimidine deaminase / 5-amino-6-(5-phosphoribosylamino)uracil reductase
VPAVLRSTTDRAPLARAIVLAERARGWTSPNPAVGCVLVRDGEVVGEGVTAPVGGPHAEVAALRMAGERARGATAYVSLEPCAHHGRTPPCADALVAAGVTRVVYAHPDPNPVATGGGEVLRGQQVEVVGDAGPVLRGAVARQLEGFLSLVRRGRPHVTLKLAQTADGQLSAPGRARWITGPEARAAVHRWRAAVDAVLVGSGTVLADDPRLDVRHVRSAHARGDGGDGTVRQPRPVVFDTRLRTPPAARVVARGALVLCGPAADDGRRAALRDAGAAVVEVPAGPDGSLDLPAALAALAAHGIASVLAEPGAVLARTLLDADLVDRFVLHVGLAVGEGTPRRVLDAPATWAIERVGGAGPDLILQHTRPLPHDPSSRSSRTVANEERP